MTLQIFLPGYNPTKNKFTMEYNHPLSRSIALFSPIMVIGLTAATYRNCPPVIYSKFFMEESKIPVFN
jgi:hypothetical protein